MDSGEIMENNICLYLVGPQDWYDNITTKFEVNGMSWLQYSKTIILKYRNLFEKQIREKGFFYVYGHVSKSEGPNFIKYKLKIDKIISNESKTPPPDDTVPDFSWYDSKQGGCIDQDHYKYETWLKIKDIERLAKPMHNIQFINVNNQKPIEGGFQHGMFYVYPPNEEIKNEPSEIVTPTKKVEIEPIHFHDQKNPISTIHDYITNQGLTFEKKIIANYYTSLKTKPFVILTGLSGTGKTKLAEYFARYMCYENGHVNEDRYAFIPVRPDWMDNRGLLGFHNLISETFQPSPLLKLMLHACGDIAKPYFVILDEMNIAKVEYYFSDFLSCLETRKRDENGAIVQEPIILHNRERCVAIENLGDSENKFNLCPDDECENCEKCGHGYKVETNGKTVMYVPPKLKIPLNVYFTGTVNVDETTYMFSPKVLDRANTIEFDEIDLNGYFNQKIGNTTDIFDQDYSDFTNKGKFYTSPNVNEIKNGFPEFEQYTNKLKELNEILQPYQMHFGYRVVNEILLYLKNAAKSGADLKVPEAFDFQIKQKILPKFHGSRNKLEEPLKEIQEFCIKNDCSESEKKIKRMLDILKSQGFVSFA